MIYLAGTDFSHLTNDELLNGIKSLKIPDYIRSKAYGIDVRETLAQMTEMLMQLAFNQGMDLEQAQEWAMQISKIDDKADQSFVDSQLSAIVSGAPKGTYTDLASLRATYPRGTDGIFLVLENGHWYYWNEVTSAWTDGGVYQASGISDGSISLQKLDFAKIVSKNKFDKNTAVSGALGSTGTVVENAKFYTSAPIKAVEGEIWKFSSNLQSYAYSNSAGTLVSVVTNAGVNSITIPSGVATFRVTFYHKNLNTFMIAKDSLPTAYEPIRYAITGDYLSNINGAEIVNGTVSQDKTDFFEPGINLLADVIDGYYLNNGGVLTANATYSTSGYVAVVEGETIIPTWQRAVTFFNSNKEFNSEIYEGAIPQNKAVVAPITGYMRVSFPTANKDGMMITKGATVPPYEMPGKKIENLLVDATQVVGLEESLADSISINLPSKIYATVGEQLKIYDDNILKEKSENYNISYASTLGAHYDGYFATAPSTAGTYSLTVSVFEKAKQVANKTVSIVVSAKRSTKIKVLEIGDSIIRANGNGSITNHLLTKLGSNIELIGSMGTAPNLWEGRGGWTAAKYRTGDTYDGVVNPFYNPNVSDFDFSYYMTNKGFSSPDVVIINLGTNDTFNYKSDGALESAIPTIISNLTYIKDSIKTYNSNIKVMFDITIPPNAFNQKFAEQKIAGAIDQEQWRYKYNNAIWVSGMIEQLDNNSLVSTHLGINAETEIADHVHPLVTGYENMAMAQYHYLNSI